MTAGTLSDPHFRVALTARRGSKSGFSGAVDMRLAPLLLPASSVARIGSCHNLRRFQHRMQQHVAAGCRPVLGNLFGLVVRDAVDAGQKIIVEGASLAAQQASWPAPEMMSRWL